MVGERTHQIPKCPLLRVTKAGIVVPRPVVAGKLFEMSRIDQFWFDALHDVDTTAVHQQLVTIAQYRRLE